MFGNLCRWRARSIMAEKLCGRNQRNQIVRLNNHHAGRGPRLRPQHGLSALTISTGWARINEVIRGRKLVSSQVGLWRSWERASMAWKRSSVRSRPGPPSFQQLSGPASTRLAGNSGTSVICDGFLGSLLIASIVAFTLSGISCM